MRIAGGDLTQRLKAPALADEIGRLTNTFDDMINRLETSIRQIHQFSSDASHELSTPLTVMKGEIEFARRRPRETDHYKIVLEGNLEEIDRITRIVDQLLLLIPVGMSEVKMEHLPVPLTRSLRTSIGNPCWGRSGIARWCYSYRAGSGPGR